MKLDRDLQRQILEALAEHYPKPIADLQDLMQSQHEEFDANVFYLYEHGLITMQIRNRMATGDQAYNQKITKDGLDFLADDGGLTAILGVVTVRLHEETVKALLEERLERSDLPEEEKRPLLQAVRELPAEATKHLTMKLLDLGADNLPRAIELVRSLMS